MNNITVFEESIKTLNGWYWQDDIWRILLQYYGSIVPFFSFERNIKKLSQSEILRHYLSQMACEYLYVSGEQISREEGKKGISRPVRTNEFMDYYVNFESPILEISQSMWQSELCSFPKRTIFYCDVEYFDNKSSNAIMVNQFEVFEYLEPFYQIITKTLCDLGLEHVAIATGRGYNFISQIPWNSNILTEIIKIGGNIEESVLERQKYSEPECKRLKIVPENTERAYKGMMRLVLFFMTMIVKYSWSKRLSDLDCGFSDGGVRGISFDPTMIMKTVDKQYIGSPCSPYLKMHFQKYDTTTDVVFNTAVPIRLIRSKNGTEFFNDLYQFLYARTNYGYILENILPFQEGYIPDGTNGMTRLINLYNQSNIKNLFDVMDSEKHDDWKIWSTTYRNYDYILKDIPELEYFLENANPKLLQPDSLRYIINLFFDRGWHPKHIAGFLCSIYENREIWWEGLFDKQDAARWANGWVEIILSERFM